MSDRVSVFCDTSVLMRYWLGDDPPRAVAAAALIERDDIRLVVSTGVIVEAVHAMRREHGIQNPFVGQFLIEFLSQEHVELIDADKVQAADSIRWTLDVSARRIPDALIAAAAERAGCQAIATFDEAFASPSVPVRLL